MKELRVECRTKSFKLTDLNLDLVQGQVLFLTGNATSSPSVQEGKQMGALGVQWVERCAVVKSPVPVLRWPRNHPPMMAAPVPVIVPQTIALEDLQAIVRAEVQAALKEMQPAQAPSVEVPEVSVKAKAPKKKDAEVKS